MLQEHYVLAILWFVISKLTLRVGSKIASPLKAKLSTILRRECDELVTAPVAPFPTFSIINTSPRCETAA